MRLIDRVLAGFGPEDREHYAVIQWCDAKGIDVFHVPNSTWTKSVMVRIKNTLLGVRAGIPDLWVPIAGVGLLVIEMKRPKETGKTNYPTPAQKAWIEKLNACPGVQAAVCYGAEEAVKLITSYLPKPTKPAAGESIF
jgi:hypothetical protein